MNILSVGVDKVTKGIKKLEFLGCYLKYILTNPMSRKLSLYSLAELTLLL